MTTSPLEEEVRRYRTLLDRTIALATTRDVAPVGTQALDAILEVLDAKRGVLGVVQDGTAADWRIVAARDAELGDLDDASSLVSSTVIERVLSELAPVLESNAMDGDLGAMASVNALQLRSIIALPIAIGERAIGFIYLDDPRFIGLFDKAALAVVESWMPVVAQSLQRALEAEKLHTDSPFPGFLTRSPVLLAELAELAHIAAFDAPVLLTGETGTGKSLVAKAIHEASPRAKGPFVHLNCAAIPEGLLEGELFGTERGAFTGAESRPGKFEAARGGTLFLDELDSMPVACQAKLLVVVQEGEVTRLGATRSRPTDVRLISATNRDPSERIAAGELREDLYYRLAVAIAGIPALRERPEDVDLLAEHVLARTSKRYDLGPLQFSAAARSTLVRHDWPGNVRELENAVHRAALLARDGVVSDVRLARRTPQTSAPGVPAFHTVRPRHRRYGTTREAFVEAWDATTTARECADVLGVSERTVFRLKQKYL